MTHLPTAASSVLLYSHCMPAVLLISPSLTSKDMLLLMTSPRTPWYPKLLDATGAFDRLASLSRSLWSNDLTWYRRIVSSLGVGYEL
jgi:hypothetical protein